MERTSVEGLESVCMEDLGAQGGRGAVKLSKRLETVASFVNRGSRVADVGTDHGLIPVELVRRGLAACAIAMDVRPGPLERARERIRRSGLEEKIETRLSDGVETLHPGEVDAVVITGMGGRTVIHILECGRHLWADVKRWVLSPQSDLDEVRKFLNRNGFGIVREEMVEEEGKYYTVMDAAFCGEAAQAEEMTEMEYLYGPRLIAKKNPVLMEFLEREQGQLMEIVKRLGGQGGERVGEQSGERVGEQVGERAGEKDEGRTGEKLGGQAGERTGEKAGTRAGRQEGRIRQLERRIRQIQEIRDL